jgi:hypothetical protein
VYFLLFLSRLFIICVSVSPSVVTTAKNHFGSTRGASEECMSLIVGQGPKSGLLEAFQHFGISSSAISIRTITTGAPHNANFTCRVQLPSIPRENFHEQVLPQ